MVTETLMLINPAKRPSKRKKARSPAQRAATRRMLAARRANPVKRAASRKRRSYTALSSLRKASRKGRRRNPIGNSVLSMFMPAAIGAVGAVAINTVESQLVARFLPAAMQGAMGKYATRIALALAVGTMGGKLLGNARARQAAEGALVVTLYDVIGSTVGNLLPVAAPATVSGIGAYAPALSDNSGMGAYTQMAGMGEMTDSPYAYQS